MLIVCSLCGFTTVGQDQGAREDQAIQLLVDKMFAGYKSKDLPGLVSLWSEKSPDLEKQKLELKRQFALYQMQFSQVKVTGIRLDGAPATAATLRVWADLSATERGKPGIQSEKLVRNIKLVKESGAWKVWRQASAFDDLAALVVAAATEEKQKEIISSNRELVGRELVESIFNLGLELQQGYKLRQAMLVFRLTEKMATESKVEHARFAALMQMGAVHHTLGELRDSLRAYDEALLAFRSNLDGGKQIELAGALINLGMVQQQRGNSHEALKLTYEALTIVEKENNPKGIAHVHLNLGQIHERQREYLAALKAYETSYVRFDEANDPVGKAHARNNMGTVSVALGDYVQGARYYEDAIELRGGGRDPIGLLTTLNNFGALHHQKAEDYKAEGHVELAEKEYLAALKRYDECLEKAEARQALWDLANVTGDKAATYMAMKNYPHAKDFAQRSAAFAERIDYREAKWKAHTTLAKALRGMGEPERADKTIDESISTIEELRTELAGGVWQVNSSLSQQ